ncbi:MAG: tRNA uridine-5-carboxymethylaminomethyl(34) synthesis GTPase MnmE [Hyphomonadaceae bacterium]|nr:MAG: trmE [Caulobacteraceae bacterium]MBT9446055.1 tRNA uridine-5-carboxymethylaminomethyl(34) synthesis GTPase MnmE [Hyphomonadaceae bacterium]TPW06276.1 MAG: trmE [Alphaproteobacteria bacterium]
MSSAATIFALASGAGRAGVAVIRVSGPDAGRAVAALSGRPLPDPRLAVRRRFVDVDGALLDDGLLLWFPGPASFTGEDVAELQIHGGAAVIEAIAAALEAQGLRLARPGEFTRRAFENGKLDLTAAEAIADLVDAETEGQRRQALRQMQGALAALYDGWRARLLTILALIEGEIDFPDEDLPDALAARTVPDLSALAAEMDAHLADHARGERVRDGYRIAIIGAPNAGKSSLLNALVQREAAIVSDTPGTTRDVVEVRLVLAGYPVWLADTAGLREAADAIESDGVRRALARAEEADLRIALVEAGANEVAPQLADALRDGDFLLTSKSDLGAGTVAPVSRDVERLAVSTATGAGLNDLLARLTRRIVSALGETEAPALTRHRHREAVRETRDHLQRALAAFRIGGAELVAEDVRLAARALGRLTGRIDVEDVLGEIFASFCIGK